MSYQPVSIVNTQRCTKGPFTQLQKGVLVCSLLKTSLEAGSYFFFRARVGIAFLLFSSESLTCVHRQHSEQSTKGITYTQVYKGVHI